MSSDLKFQTAVLREGAGLDRGLTTVTATVDRCTRGGRLHRQVVLHRVKGGVGGYKTCERLEPVVAILRDLDRGLHLHAFFVTAELSL